MDAIIFDIDGTLADVEHRRHLLGGNGQRPNWPGFFDAMVDDPPMDDIVMLYDLLTYAKRNMTVFLCSGRPDDYRGETQKWLFDNDIGGYYDTLYMRKAGDYRADTIIKKEMLDDIRSRGFNVRLAIDDRKSVVDMWRANGVTCLQCAPGFDEKPQFTPGKLHMMVGPSGAGKSYYAAVEFPTTWIVSSDQVRADLCDGDFKDQSKNKQVWACVHAIVKARVENGMDTVLDATNLRNRDRRAVRDSVPANTKIVYHVIDRPKEIKHRDSGWRKHVRVRNMLLVDDHDSTMRSNIKDILAGDNDPRVTVLDKRQIVKKGTK